MAQINSDGMWFAVSVALDENPNRPYIQTFQKTGDPTVAEYTRNRRDLNLYIGLPTPPGGAGPYAEEISLRANVLTSTLTYGSGISLPYYSSYIFYLNLRSDINASGAVFATMLYASNSVITTNVYASSFIGDGSLLTNLSGAAVSGDVSSAGVVTQSYQPAITSVGTLTSLTSSGDVSAARFIGGGSLLTNLSGAAVSGDVSSAGVVTQAYQPAITSVGTLTSLATSGQVQAVGNVASSISGICAPVIYRQGGDAANWSVGGLTNTPVSSGAVNIQVGARVTSTTTTAVTFPQAYVNTPIVFITKTGSTAVYLPAVSSITRTGFNIIQLASDGTTVNWMAIGI
jgi:hypothetical protein